MRYAIGIDLGGTKIEGVLADETGKVIEKFRTETQADQGLDTVLSNIEKVFSSLKKQEIEGVGIGTPGFVKPDGTLTCIHNIGCLMDFNLEEELKTRLNCKVIVENDANCFALAEHMFGAGKGSKNMIGVIVGTGVGGGIIINGKLYSGSIGGAGEFGHSIIDPAGIECTCGQTGDFESWCAGPNLVKAYLKHGGEDKNATPETLFPLEEPAARKAMEDMIKHLGIGLANLVNTLNPDIIVLGGGISNMDFYDKVREQVKKYANKTLAEHVKIVKNELGDSAGVLGAAALVFEV